jgi:Fur family ferric uptake transcriptional regulator
MKIPKFLISGKEEMELLKKTEKTLSKKYNFEIKNHLVQFYGLCDKCK